MVTTPHNPVDKTKNNPMRQGSVPVSGARRLGRARRLGMAQWLSMAQWLDRACWQHGWLGRAQWLGRAHQWLVVYVCWSIQGKRCFKSVYIETNSVSPSIVPLTSRSTVNMMRIFTSIIL